jgi:PAS domain-containing protein
MSSRSLTPRTFFASAERAPYASIEADARLFQGPESFPGGLAHFPCPLLVLNAERQAVYVNRALTEFLRAEPGDILGLRIGEIFYCIHAGSDLGGCGTAQACCSCGVTHAVLAALEGSPNHRECRVDVLNRGDGSTLEFCEHAIPFELKGKKFILVALIDLMPGSDAV